MIAIEEEQEGEVNREVRYSLSQPTSVGRRMGRMRGKQELGRAAVFLFFSFFPFLAVFLYKPLFLVGLSNEFHVLLG